METSSILWLVVSASISFGIGRTVVYFRDRRRKAQKEEAQERQKQALRDAPPEPVSRNKGKRRRQQIEKSGNPR